MPRVIMKGIVVMVISWALNGIETQHPLMLEKMDMLITDIFAIMFLKTCGIGNGKRTDGSDWTI